MWLRRASFLILSLQLVSWQCFAHDADDCDSNSDCMNGGACERVIDDTTSSSHIHTACQCVDDFIGPFCVERCLISCQNGGVCQRLTTNDSSDEVTDSSDFMCICPSTYDGALCDTKKQYDTSTSSSSRGKTIGIVFGVGVAAATILMCVTYLRRRAKPSDGQEPKNVIDSTSMALDDKATNDLSSSNNATMDSNTVV